MELRATAALPDDIDALKALVLAHAAKLHERDVQLADLKEQLSSRALEIEHLKLMIAKLRRMQFGRKSEKLDRQIEQLELRLEDLQADEGAGRKPLPDHIEREEP
jgi:transposase